MVLDIRVRGAAELLAARGLTEDRLPGPLYPCRQPGCPELLQRPGWCEEHRERNRKQYEDRSERAADRAFYGSSAWRKVRHQKLSRTPGCERCGQPASQVHHRRPRKQVPELALVIENLESLCASCHSRHEAFGRQR